MYQRAHFKFEIVRIQRLRSPPRSLKGEEVNEKRGIEFVAAGQ